VATINLQVKGLKQLNGKLRANMPKARQAVKVELNTFCNEVLQASLEVVPMLTGALAGSGKVMGPVETASSISYQIGYGDEAVGYALYVHEALEGPYPINPDWSWAKAVAAGKQIQWTRPGSGPKFLENPLKAKQDQLPDRLGKVFREALKS